MTASSPQYDILIIGGGAIGLSLAWQLAEQRQRVGVVDRGAMGQEASWAGAGMIPPGPPPSCWETASAFDRLAGLSGQLHAEWRQTLLERTGIDNEYRCHGALHLATTMQQATWLEAEQLRWRQLAIEVEPIGLSEMAKLEPALNMTTAGYCASLLVPGEAQIRNPRHLRALASACQQGGVELLPQREVRTICTQGEQITAVDTGCGQLTATRYCLAAGCWSGQLVRDLPLDLPIRPVRGQILLLRGPVGLLSRTVCCGSRYLVPRSDGRVLVGSTEESVGFDKSNTSSAIDELKEFAQKLVPQLSECKEEERWAGLRPASSDRLPILGRLPGTSNGWIATGHFRAGLQLSPATAVVMAALMLGQQPPIEVAELGAERFAAANSN